MKALTEKPVQTRLRAWGYGLVCGIGLLTSNPAKATAPTLNTLYSFTGGADGDAPEAGLIADKNGNLFGTTTYGGEGTWKGTVFEMTKNGTLKTLYRFTDGDDGTKPSARLIADKNGNLFGTTNSGGKNGGGTVFELTPNGTLKTLYSFSGRDDGGYPTAGLIADKNGNLFGTTRGTDTDESPYGTVFELTPNGTLKTLHRFTGGNDGAKPVGELIADKNGNLFGTTQGQGGGPLACGTVFELTKDGTFKTLHRFTAGNDGCAPYDGLIADNNGNLFGTTAGGGTSDNGTVFKVTKNGTYNILYRFTGGKDGSDPRTRLIADKNGNLFGTTKNNETHVNGGTVFELTQNCTLRTLYSFTGGKDGSGPYGGLIADNNGNLFGTTINGGKSDKGTVFELTNTPFQTGAPSQSVP